MRPLRVCVCMPHVLYVHGGAENLVEGLLTALTAHGMEAEVVRLPWADHQRSSMARSAIAWRLLDLQCRYPIDLVIATRFPAYLIRHPNKVIWLLHQFRQVYDLKGTRYSDIGNSPDDPEIEAMVRRMDQLAFSEARSIFAIAGNVADRLKRYNGFEAKVLYPPTKLEGQYRPGDFGDYVFSAGRLDQLKRSELLVRAMRYAPRELRCKIAGDGPERESLAGLIAELGLEDRVELLGFVDERELLDLYSGSLCVFFAPYDEDYGYVTIEAFKSGKPVITASDSGGALEFVSDGENGYVVDPRSPRDFARRFQQLLEDRAIAERLGEMGRQRVSGISWGAVVRALTH